MIEYELGQAVRITAAFENALGAATDPTTITFKTGRIAANPPPDPTATNAVFGVDSAVIKDSVGNYHYDLTPASPGTYIYSVVGTGTVAAVFVGRFRVKPSPFAESVQHCCMARGPDETTDKMFPPMEGGIPPERPLPLQPSIRETFVVHHSVMLQQWADFRAELLGLVDKKKLDAHAHETPSSIVGKMKAGALTGLRYGGVAVAAGELAAQVAAALGHPDIEGPIRVFLQLVGG